MIFTIRKNATLPKLSLKLYKDGRNDFNKFDDLIENSAITFAMRDENTGIYKVINKEATISLKTPCNDDGDKEYYINYQFSSEDTDTPGVYIGQFKIIFTDYPNNTPVYGELIVPIREELYIHVIDSFVKSEVIN